ncbi:glycosyltransferase [Candidatus Uhrbacteria bacterium]|nr:glycosyltransferase [Candidatus Uhrbacteria bacterium]
MAKPLLVQVVWTLGRAGAERMVLDLCRSLSNEYRIEVIALGGGGEMETDLKAAGIRVTIAPATKTGLDRRKLTDWLITRWSEQKPDIVHTHLGADVWAGFACRKLRIPQVITAHSHEPGLSLPVRLLRWQAYRGATHVVSVSESVRNMVTRQYGVSTSKQSVIHIGIDLSRFIPRDAHQAGDMPHLVTVGRLLEDKGQAVLLDALSTIRRPWTLEIIGDGPERISLQRKAETLGIMPRVNFAGSVGNVPERLRHADLFLLASRHEGQAIAVLEAAAAQVPVLVSDLPVFHETFPPDTLAFASVDDVDAWSKAISDVLNQYGKAMERARRARHIIEQSFSMQSMKDAYNKLYRGLLG